MASIELDDLLKDPFWEEQLEKALHFNATFHSLLNLAYKRKDSKALLKTISSTDPPTFLKRSSRVARGGPPNKKAKFTSSSSSTVIAGSTSQHTMEADSLLSQDSATSTDEDSTKLLLFNFMMDCLRFLRSPFTMPTWSQVKVKLDVWYNPAIIFILTSHSPHDTRFRLSVETIRTKDDKGLNLVTMTGDRVLWRPSEYDKILPIVSLEVYP